MKPKIVVICGPTGVGKTSVGIALAELFGGEIVGADSMQIYRHMDIGTAKPTPDEQARVFHHLVDVANPDEPYDAAKYADSAGKAVDEILEKGKLPIVVGGTGFYIKTLIHGIFHPGQSDSATRERLKNEAAGLGIRRLHARLGKYDPEIAEKLHPNDAYRIIRALEVFESTGTPISKSQDAHGFSQTRYNALKICLSTDRQTLYERIDARTEQMMAEGFVDEVRRLLDMGYSRDLRPMQSIGYRHIIEFLEGKTLWDETVRILKRDTRRYAKRQLTWFRADPNMNWAHPNDFGSIREWVEKFLIAADDPMKRLS